MSDNKTMSDDRKMDYYICVRNTIQKFDELVCKVAIEGGTFSLALLSLSGIFFRESFCLAAMIIAFGSMSTSFCFGVMATFYSKLLGVSVEIAKGIEDEIFPATWNPTEEDVGKKLTYSIDMHGKLFGKRLAGKNTWKVIILEFGILFAMGIILFFFYVSQLCTYACIITILEAIFVISMIILVVDYLDSISGKKKRESAIEKIVARLSSKKK